MGGRENARRVKYAHAPRLGRWVIYQSLTHTHTPVGWVGSFTPASAGVKTQPVRVGVCALHGQVTGIIIVAANKRV